MMFRYERELYDPVIRWLEEAGFVWAKHVCTPIYLQCDIAAGRFIERTNRKRPPLIESVMIELKLSEVKRAIEQAAHYANFVNLSYVAMPVERCNRMTEKTRTRFADTGIGLLAVDSDAVETIVQPTRRTETHEMIVRNLWRRRSQN